MEGSARYEEVVKRLKRGAISDGFGGSLRPDIERSEKGASGGRIQGQPHRSPGPASYVRSSASRFITFGATALILAGAVQQLGAQTVDGRVFDEVTERPIQEAHVVLQRADGTIAWQGAADTLGRFTIAAAPGEYRLRTSRLGYTDLVTPLLPFQRARGIRSTSSWSPGRLS